MPDEKDLHITMARAFLVRAERRINGAPTAAARPDADPGEFDNNYDGVVTAIFHIVDAYEVATTKSKRRVGEAEQTTRIQSVLAQLGAVKTPRVPPGSRFIDLNRRRSTSVHGEWMQVVDQDALQDAIRSARDFQKCCAPCPGREGDRRLLIVDQPLMPVSGDECCRQQ